MKNTTNVFSKGLTTDLHPLNTSNELLTDALNATFITYNGNEYILLNDMGNTSIQDSISGAVMGLSPGFVPVGMTEHGGVFYIASFNPKTLESELGTIPSPVFNYSYLTPAEIQSDKQYTLFKGYDLSVINNSVRISDNIFNVGDVFAIELQFNNGNNLPIFRRLKKIDLDISQSVNSEEFNLLTSSNGIGLLTLHLLAEDTTTNGMFDLNVHNTYKQLDSSESDNWFYNSKSLIPNKNIESKLSQGHCIAYPNMQSGLLHIKPELMSFKLTSSLLLNNTSLRNEPYYNKETTITVNIEILDTEVSIGEEGYTNLFKEGKYVIVGKKPIKLLIQNNNNYTITVETYSSEKQEIDEKLQLSFLQDSSILIQPVSGGGTVTPPISINDILGLNFDSEKDGTVTYKVLTQAETGETSLYKYCSESEDYTIARLRIPYDNDTENYNDFNKYIIYSNDTKLQNISSINKKPIIEYAIFTELELKDTYAKVFDTPEAFSKSTGGKYIQSMEQGQTCKISGNTSDPFVRITQGDTMELNIKALESAGSKFVKWEGITTTDLLSGYAGEKSINKSDLPNSSLHLLSTYEKVESLDVEDRTVSMRNENDAFYIFKGNSDGSNLVEYDERIVTITSDKIQHQSGYNTYLPRYNNISLPNEESTDHALIDITDNLTINDNENNTSLLVSGFPLSFVSSHLNTYLDFPNFATGHDDIVVYDSYNDAVLYKSVDFDEDITQTKGILAPRFFSYYLNTPELSSVVHNDYMKYGTVGTITNFSILYKEENAIRHFCNDKYLAYVDLIFTENTRVRGLVIVDLEQEWTYLVSEYFGKRFTNNGYIFTKENFDDILKDYKYIFLPVHTFSDKLDNISVKDMFDVDTNNPRLDVLFFDDIDLLTANNALSGYSRDYPIPLFNTYLLDFAGLGYYSFDESYDLVFRQYGLNLRYDVLGEIVMYVNNQLEPTAKVFFGLYGTYVNNVFSPSMDKGKDYWSSCLSNNVFQGCSCTAPFGISPINSASDHSIYYKPVHRFCLSNL